MFKIGKKTKLWNETRKLLKVEFEGRGITTCELRFVGCWNNNALGFAHVDKRRYLADWEITQVVVACNPCHGVIEAWPRLKMREYLENIINNR